MTPTRTTVFCWFKPGTRGWSSISVIGRRVHQTLLADTRTCSYVCCKVPTKGRHHDTVPAQGSRRRSLAGRHCGDPSTCRGRRSHPRRQGPRLPLLQWVDRTSARQRLSRDPSRNAASRSLRRSSASAAFRKTSRRVTPPPSATTRSRGTFLPPTSAVCWLNGPSPSASPCLACPTGRPAWDPRLSAKPMTSSLSGWTAAAVSSRATPQPDPVQSCGAAPAAIAQ
jgi:hypothetical protein